MDTDATKYRPTEETLVDEPTSSWPLETIHSEEETKSLDIASVESDDALLPRHTPTITQGTATVTSKRKHELLIQAREDRLRWIQKVPLPFLNAGSLDPLEHFLTNSHASRLLPHAPQVLSYLYGDFRSNSSGKGDELLRTESTTVYLTGQQILSHEIDQAADDKETTEILLVYQRFLKYLQDPSSNVLVQGTRTFCRNFVDLQDPKVAAAQLQAYLQSSKVPADMKHCFEAFVFGHCREAIERITQPSNTQSGGVLLEEKLESLQFVQPSHLDIAIDEELLPISALQSIDRYHSVYDKLQMVLKMYRSVNEALKKASDTLPSADDVLPGVIYTVIRAKANRLQWNLSLIEEWSPSDYLRGEAGYAFTNLYGAVQFLMDLKDSSSLTISQSEFAEKMTEYRQKVDQRIQQRVDVPVVKEETLLAKPMRAPSAAEIRRARKNGEIINLDWALAWQKDQPLEKPEDSEDSTTQERRQYSFLGTKQEDVRISDLPKLLEEYRDLYHRNESYQTDKSRREAKARRKQNEAVEKDLIATARSLDLL